MKRAGASVAVGFALLLCAATSGAQGNGPVQLTWQAPANCPQEAQVRQKLRDLVGVKPGVAQSRLRAEGQIEALGERFRLTLNIHYDLVNGTRVVLANACEDLGGVAAITLALLFRAEQDSGSPLTARDLGGSASERATPSGAESDPEASRRAPEKTPAPIETHPAESSTSDERADSGASGPARTRFLLRAPILRSDVGVLPALSYGVGFAAGVRRDSWRFIASGTYWFPQTRDAVILPDYGGRFTRLSAELSACRGSQFASFELSPCLLLALDDVSARGTGLAVESTARRASWFSAGAALDGLWHLDRHAALLLGINARVATSRPRFVSEGIGEIAQIGPAAFGVALGCEWIF